MWWSAHAAPCSLPRRGLGLIVIDEEHDASFKQDSVPRYHARDVALFRTRGRERAAGAGQRDAVAGKLAGGCDDDASTSLIPGTATEARLSLRPKLVSMPSRVNESPAARRGRSSICANEVRSARSSKGSISRPLHNAMRQTIDDGGQVILLLNRRGFSTHVQCPACGFVARCPQLRYFPHASS